MSSGFVCFATRSGIVCYRRSSAEFANCRHREDAGLCFIVLQNVLLTDIVCREYRNEGRRPGGFLHARTTFGLFPLDQAHYSDDFETELARGLDRLYRRCSGRAYVVYDDHTRALFAEAFDALPGAVLLFCFADQKSV